MTVHPFFPKWKREESNCASENAASESASNKKFCLGPAAARLAPLTDPKVFADSEENIVTVLTYGWEDDSSRGCDGTISSCNTELESELPIGWTEEQAAYFKAQHQWLVIKKGKLGCSVCAKVSHHGFLRTGVLRVSKEWIQSFVCTASTTKKGQQTALRKKIYEHKASHSHHEAEMIVLRAKDGEFEKNTEKQNACQEEVTNRIFRNAYMVSKKDRPFTDLPVLVDLQIANGLSMGRVLQSRKSCADICDFIGKEMKMKLTKYIVKEDLKFAILIDECTTVSHLSVLSVCIRTAFGGEPTSFFWELLELEKTNAEAITRELQSCLLKYFPQEFIKKKTSLIHRRWCICNDGSVSGVAAQLRKPENYPGLLVWRCCNHRLELAVGDALKEVCGTNNFKSFMDALYALYHCSPKNRRELHTFADQLAVIFRAIGRVLDTRWVASSCRTVKAVWDLCPALAVHFQSAAVDPNRGGPERAKYRGLLERLTAVEFVKNLGLMRDALCELSELSLKLQANSVTLPGAHILICRQIKVFEVLAGGRQAEFTKIATESADTLTFQGVNLHGGRKVDVEINRLQFFRSLANAMQNRLLTTASSHVPGTSGEAMASEFHNLISACQVVYPRYWPNDYDILFGEDEVQALCKRFQLPSRKIVSGFWEYKDSGGKRVPEEMLPLMRTMDTIAISTAECERVFSHMNNTLTPLRNSLGIVRVSNLLFVHRNGTPLAVFSPEKYVKKWLLQGRRGADHTACRARENKPDCNGKKSLVSTVNYRCNLVRSNIFILASAIFLWLPHKTMYSFTQSI
ncbi:E3 SUMO-protein ligase KIAA1586-like [Ambystoma mexicanum]|uniref:E3 SUMO-protein ligase KIAA1586-like n=1 Tax=Ambystoma mexicanum TaxID=8296 RepID=UPI0037E955B4